MFTHKPVVEQTETERLQELISITEYLIDRMRGKKGVVKQRQALVIFKKQLAELRGQSK